jgi:hypothetical protein
VGQYWKTYCAAYRETKGRYPPNGGYHLMLTVIGVSFTAEDLMIGAYEHTIGWLSECVIRVKNCIAGRSLSQKNETDGFMELSVDGAIICRKKAASFAMPPRV